MRLTLSIFVLFLTLGSCAQKKAETGNMLNVLDYDAKPDGQTLCTKAFQAALDEASELGATVYVPKGDYLIGTIFLKSNTVLELSTKARLLGSTRLEDYAELSWGHNEDRTPYHLIVVKDAENVTIQGRGTIDGQGKNWYDYTDVKPRWMKKHLKRPSPMIEIQNSKNIKVKDLLLTNSAGWTMHAFNSEVIHVHGIRLINNLYGPNNDGIDITGCENVMISDCYIRTCDDAVCLKTTPDSKETHNVTVTNCVMHTTCVALKFGETSKYMSDVTFSNCVITNSSRAFGIYATWGGDIENVQVSNIVCNTNAPLVLNRPFQLMACDIYDKEGKLKRKGGNIRNITVSNFTATTEGRILVSANHGHKIENIVVRDLTLNYPYIENPDRYAPYATSGQFRGIDSASMHAHAAFVASNVNNLVLDNVLTNWNQTDTIPKDWQHPERIENGKFDKVHKPSYDQVRPVPFHMAYLSNVQGGYVFAPLATSSDGSLPVVKRVASDIQVMGRGKGQP